MLKHLFTPKWQHPDLQIRLQALELLDATADLEIILQVFANDPSAEMRALALDLIDDASQLNRLLSQATKIEDWNLVASRLLKYDPDSPQQITQAFETKRQNWSPQQIATMLCESEVELAELVLDACQNEAELHQSLLVELAIAAKAIPLRLLAVQQIETEASLQVLVKQATHKQVLQVARQKLKQYKALEESKNTNRNAAQHICEALDKLSRQSWDKQIEFKVASYQKQWQALDLAGLTDEPESYRLALAACDKILANNKKETEKLLLIDEAANKQVALCSKLEELQHEMSQENLVSVQTHQDAYHLIEKNWLQISEEVDPDEKLKKRYTFLQQAILNIFAAWDKLEQLSAEFNGLCEESVLWLQSSQQSQQKSAKRDVANEFEELSSMVSRWKKNLAKLAWPKQLEQPQSLSQWADQIKLIIDRAQKIESSQKKKSAQLLARIRSLQKDLQQRNLIAANKTSNYINAHVDDLFGDFKEGIVKKLEQIQPELDELRDWHSFATTPKKQDLCELMEQLIEQQQAPLERAKAVRAMQEQWRALVASDTTADRELWDRFKLAADTAYKPCLEYYAEQDKVKAENLQQRLTICAELEKLIDDTKWDSVDWKVIEKTQRKAIEQWKKYSAVPANERHSSQRHFDKLIAVISEKSKHEKETNLALRIELVEKANQLLSLDDVNKAINNAKRLQSQWKDLGITFYKADREQWLLFRKALDAVFERRNAEKQSVEQALAANATILLECIEKIKAMLELDDEELKQSKADFDSIQAQWDLSLELPRAQASQLNADFYKVCQNYSEHFAGISGRIKARRAQALKQNIDRLIAIEESLLNGDTVDFGDAQRMVESSYCNDGEKQLLLERLQNLVDANEYIVNQAGVAELERLALKAEILTECESPSEFKSQRMAFQLEQLQQGLTSKYSQSEIQTQVNELYLSWLTVGLIDKVNRAKLEQRLSNVLDSVDLN